MAALTPRTPMTSARKLFPRSPSSDCESDNSLGHMSPLSSPDRYSSPLCTPEKLCESPKNGVEHSPRTPVRISPRNSRFDPLKASSKVVGLSSLFLHRDVRRLRKHIDLNNTSELDKSFSKTLDVENENTPAKLATHTVIPPTPSQKSSNFGIVEESPNTPSVNKSPVTQSTDTSGNMRKAALSGAEPSIPVSMFYSKPNLTRELFPVPDSSNSAKLTKQGHLGAVMKESMRYGSVDSLRSIKSKRSTRIMRRKLRYMPGEINAGVYHKLRRPKPKKLSYNVVAAYKMPSVMPRSKAESILRSAGLPVDLISLGQQVAQNSSNLPAPDETPQEPQGFKRKLPDPPTPPPDPSKKFFKTNRTIHKTKTVTFEGNIKIRVAEGKFSLNRAENSLKFRTRKVLKFRTTGSSTKNDPLFEAIDDEKMEQVNSSVRQLLENLENEPAALQSDLDSAVAAGSIIIASVPAEETLKDMESRHMESTDEVVPGTPEKGQIIAECVVGANGELASPGLSFITSSLAISEDNTVPCNTAELLNGSWVPVLAETVVEIPTDSSRSERQGVLSNTGELAASEGTTAAVKCLVGDNVANSTLESSENECSDAPHKENSCKKYFPLFYKSPESGKKALSDVTNKKSPQSGRKLPWRFNRDDQYQIDAGQKKLGAAQCSECGLVYSEGDMEDELAHLNYHNSTQALRFLGWKQERVVATHNSGRIVVVHPGDPKSWWKKVSDVVEVVDKDLGYAEGGSGLHIQGSKVYLYIESKSVVGCLVAQPITTAHRLQVTNGLDTCSQESYPVKCGVSRLWVVISHRRQKIATRLVDCMRANFMYGYILGVEEFAFSVPTVSGKEFGTNYTRKQNFMVYM